MICLRHDVIAGSVDVARPGRKHPGPGRRLLGQDRRARCQADRGDPHGIRYSLTLHEPYGTRILGYDNAHAVKPPKKFRHAGCRYAYDHRHRHARDRGVPYEFTDAYQLLSDFFNEVDRVLKEHRPS